MPSNVQGMSDLFMFVVQTCILYKTLEIFESRLFFWMFFIESEVDGIQFSVKMLSYLLLMMTIN